MRRTKTTITKSDSSKTQAKKFPPKKSFKDQAIDDRLANAARGELKEVIYIGQIVEDQLKGEFGSILRALLRGRSAAELAESRVHTAMTSDRFLGRLDAYDKILQDLEQYVIDKDNAAIRLIESKVSKDQKDLHTAPELGEEKEVAHA